MRNGEEESQMDRGLTKGATGFHAKLLSGFPSFLHIQLKHHIETNQHMTRLTSWDPKNYPSLLPHGNVIYTASVIPWGFLGLKLKTCLTFL